MRPSSLALLPSLLVVFAAACQPAAVPPSAPANATGKCLATPADSASVARPSTAPTTTEVVEVPPPPLPPRSVAGPGASGGGENDLFAVVIAADGNLIVRGERLANDAALAAFARQAHTKNADVRVRIDADARVTYGRVIQVMDTLKQSGISKIAFGVTPAPTPP